MHAQGLLSKIKNKVQQRINSAEDKTIDKTLDKIEGKDDAVANKNNSATNENTQPTSLASYSKYDFVPGDSVLYAEDFSNEAMGELPAGWNTSGKGEVVTLNNFPGNWLKLGDKSSFLSANKKEFTKNFTIEFDLVLQLENTGQYWPTVKFGFLSSGELSADDNELLHNYHKYQSSFVEYHANTNGGYCLVVSELNGSKFISSDQLKTPSLKNYFNQVSHIAIQVQGKRLRIWMNGEKQFDMPMAVADQYPTNQLYIDMGPYTDPRFGYYISNIKVAAGLPDTRHKLIEQGKFSTTGILFDVNKATIKPESYGVLKEIASALNEDKNFKVKIIGHTDSDGNEASNLMLSQKRAEAVKDILVNEFSIDGSRITTEGKGESEPIADNSTKEGKAQNRRVEFIKQ